MNVNEYSEVSAGEHDNIVYENNKTKNKKHLVEDLGPGLTHSTDSHLAKREREDMGEIM